MLNRKIMQLRSDEICQIEHSKPEATYLRRVKYKASKFQNFNFSVVVVAIMLMSTHALIQPNIEERLDLTGFKTITEQTATLARLMNAIFLQNHFQLGLVTMEDVITEVFDVSKSPLFNNINERDIRDTVRAMKDFDLLTTTPIDDRISWFDQFLPNGALTNISAVPELSSYANGKIDYNVCTTEYYDVERDMGILVAYTLHESNTSRDTAREFFPRL
uniref:WSN domain-containing protein n=1 Tax=Caenorhabditis japonica TaxID=281687 RepID=A0A8R1EPA6_CAEJA